MQAALTIAGILSALVLLILLGRHEIKHPNPR